MGLAYARHRYAVLFYSLLFMLIALPTAHTLGLPPIALNFLIAACLLAAVMPNATKRTRYAFFAAILALILVRLSPNATTFLSTLVRSLRCTG